MRRAFVILLVAAVALGVSGAVGVAVADTGANETATNETAEAANDHGYSLEELRRSGTTTQNSPPSVRLSSGQMFWVEHWPASAVTGDPGDPMDDSAEFLEADETVERNSVWLRTINVDSSETLTVHVVSYDVDEKVVTEDNQTTTVQHATNVNERTVEVEMSRGWAIAEVPLGTTDEERHVTMWVEGHEDELRWTFTHKSVATTQPASISTQGDYLYHASMDFLLPIILGSFGVGLVVRRSIKRAGIGPQWGYLKWLILLTIGTVAVVLSQFSSLAEVIVAAPRLAALFVVGVVGIVLIETYTTNVSLVSFQKPILTDALSPSGNDAVDMIRAEEREEHVVRMDDNSLAVVRPGLLAFLSRCFGGAARLQNAEGVQTRLTLEESPADERFYVHPKADEVLEYEPEGWTFQVPEIESRSDAAKMGVYAVFGLLVAWIVAAIAGSSMWGAVTLALLVAALTVRPTNGHARFWPAPAHMRSAWASMLYLNVEVEDADTLDEYRKRTVELQARSEKEKEQAIEEQDATLVQEAFNSDVERSVDVKPDLNGAGDPTTDEDETKRREAES